MTKLWDMPPLPLYGDVDADQTYRSVGRLMSAWESIEFRLCLIHSVFKGDPRGEAMRLYGQKRQLPGRLDDFKAAAWDYFVRHPGDQAKEGELRKLVEEVRRYADRRNEVAHGIVLEISNITFFRRYLKSKSRTPPQFAVVAPYHAEHKHSHDGLPLYAYTSTSIEALVKNLLELSTRLGVYEKSL